MNCTRSEASAKGLHHNDESGIIPLGFQWREAIFLEINKEFTLNVSKHLKRVYNSEKRN